MILTGQGQRKVVPDIPRGTIVGFSTFGIYDYSGNGHHGTLRGTPSLIASPVGAAFGNAFDFDGVDADALSGGVVSDTEISTSGLGAFCLEARIRKDRVGTNEVPVAWLDYSNTAKYVCALFIAGATDKISGFVFNAAGATVATVTYAASALGIGTFEASLAWDGTNVRLFIDGTVRATAALSVATFGATRSAPLGAARYGGHLSTDAGSPYPFDGAIDEVRLSSAARYTVNYTPALAPFTDDASTLVLWHLDDYPRIPAGWLICDGTNGTPDLRDRFILGDTAVGAGTAGGTVAADSPGLAHSGFALAAHSNHVIGQPAAHSNHTPTQPAAHSAHAVTQPSTHSTHASQGGHTHDAHTISGTGSAAVAGAKLVGPTTHSSDGAHTHDAHPAHAGWGVDAHSAHAGFAVDAHSAHSGAALNAHSAHAITQADTHQFKSARLVYIYKS